METPKPEVSAIETVFNAIAENSPIRPGKLFDFCLETGIRPATLVGITLFLDRRGIIIYNHTKDRAQFELSDYGRQIAENGGMKILDFLPQPRAER